MAVWFTCFCLKFLRLPFNRNVNRISMNSRNWLVRKSKRSVPHLYLKLSQGNHYVEIHKCYTYQHMLTYQICQWFPPLGQFYNILSSGNQFGLDSRKQMLSKLFRYNRILILLYCSYVPWMIRKRDIGEISSCVFM